MKIVFISDDGSKHKLVSLKYGFQYILPLLFLSLFFVSSLYFTHLLNGSEAPSHPKFVEYNSLPSSSIERIHFHLISKKIAELNDSVKYLAEHRNIDINTSELDSDTTPDSRINQQESKLNHVKSRIELKELEAQALELYTDKSNGVRLISDFIMPVSNGRTTSRFGFRKDPINGSHRNHRGIDVAAPKGTSVRSIADGYVTFIGRRGAYGKVLEITHSDSLKSRYAHLHSYNVGMGKIVLKGDKIGEVGSTGRVTGPHLHLEVWKKGKTVDPNLYLSGIKYIEN